MRLYFRTASFFCPEIRTYVLYKMIVYARSVFHRLVRGLTMNRLIKNAAAFGFLILFLPYTMTLLMNGRQGIHREEELSSLEYQVLSCLMSEDYSWMEDETLELMAVLYGQENREKPRCRQRSMNKIMTVCMMQQQRQKDRSSR